MILYLIECETFITIKTEREKKDGWMEKDRERGGEMVAEDEGEDKRETREKRRRVDKRWRKEEITKEVNECPSPDGVVI